MQKLVYLQDETQEITEAVAEEFQIATRIKVIEETPVIEEVASENFHQELKKRFIEGGPGFMGIVLLCLS